MRFKSNKYGARQKCSSDGIKFHSTAEFKRYNVLKHRLKRGEIEDLQLQVKYLIIGNEKSKRDCKAHYIADFVYKQGGVTVVEDVKNPVLAKQEATRLKCKLMKNVHNIDVIYIDPKDVMR